MLGFLDHVKCSGGNQDITLTDEQFEKLGIELFELDFETGETSPQVTPYFMPTRNNALTISSNGADPIDDEFTIYNRSRTKKVWGDGLWPSYLAGAFGQHAIAARERAGLICRWKSIM